MFRVPNRKRSCLTFLKDLTTAFPNGSKPGDIIMAGANFGCGSSREHPSVGLAFAGIKAVICKSVNRIFYRSAVNQGLPILLVPEAVDAYKQGDKVDIDFEKGIVTVTGKQFRFCTAACKTDGDLRGQRIGELCKE